MKFFFKKILPKRETIFKANYLRNLIHKNGNAQIWQINRRTISAGIAIGVFFGALPIPIQIPCAILTAIFLRANIIMSAVCTLWSNPLTFPIVFYFEYRVGYFLLSNIFNIRFKNHVNFDFSNLPNLTGKILFPLFTGSIIVGIIFSAISFAIIHYSWKYSLLKHIKARQKKYAKILPKPMDKA